MTVPAATVTQYYTGIFRQAPSAAVSSAYQAMATPADALNSMLSAANASVDPVVRLYQTAFNRVPDSAGMTAWVVPFSTGAITLQAIANGFTQSTEFTTLYPTTMSNSQFVGALYYNILHRAGEDTGMAGWINALNTGALTRAQVLLGFSDSGEFKALIEPNVNAFLSSAANNTATYTGSLFDQGGGGNTVYTLTPGVDVKVGTAGNDVFDGSVNATGQVTWQGYDSLTGGDGNDTLIAQNIGAVTVNAGGLTGVESVQLYNQTAGTAVDLTAASGVTTVGINAPAGAATVQGIGAGILSVSVSGQGSVPAAADIQTFTVQNAAASGTADAITLNVNNVGATGAVDTVIIQPTSGANGFETVNVVASGVSSNFTLNDGGSTSMTNLNINASVALTIVDGAATATTYDASASTAAVTLTVGTVGAVAVTGGAGADVIDMSNTYGNTDTVNGGNGADRMILTAGQAAVTSVQSNVSNVETIQVGGGATAGALAGQTITLSNFGATGFRLGADFTVGGTINLGAGTRTVDFQGNDDAAGGVALTFNSDATSTADIVNVSLGTTAGGAVAQTGALTFNNSETVNITSTGAANSLGNVTVSPATGTAVNALGSQSLTVGIVSATTINASGMTGNAAFNMNSAGNAANITGTGNADSLVGSTAADVINGGAGADILQNALSGANNVAGDVITGGAGFDTFRVIGTAASTATNYNGVAYITDFTVGSTTTTTDILSFDITNASYNTSALRDQAGAIAATAAGAGAIQNLAQNAAGTAFGTGAQIIKLTTGVAFNTDVGTTWAAAMGTATITGATAGGDYLMTYFDTTNSRMVVVIADPGAADTTISAADTIIVVGSVAMSAADYASFGVNNYNFVNY